MKTLNQIIAIIIVTITLGCEKEIPYKGEFEVSKLVVHGFFSNKDSILMHVGSSSSILNSNQGKNISNATIKILNGENTVTTFIYNKLGYYKPQQPFVPKPGVNYKLEVSAPGFKSVEAWETIPMPVNVTVDTTITPSPEPGFKNVHFDFKFKDPKGIKNYYSIEIFRTDTFFPDPTDSTKFDTFRYRIYATSNDPSVEKIEGSDLETGETYNSIFLLRDNLFDGQYYSFSIEDSYYSSSSSKSFDIRFRTLTENHFNHTLSFEKYQLAEYDPFAQPVQIFNNIENGLGIFAGYTEFNLKIN